MAKTYHPDITIVIPTLNEQKVIERAIRQFKADDVANQLNLQVVVSDGGSSDNTLDIADKYADVVVRADPNVTQTIALGRNLGAAKAKSRILMFIDADVRLDRPQEFLKQVINQFELDDRLVALACKVETNTEEQTSKDRFFHSMINLGFSLATRLRIAAGRGECQIVRRTCFEAIGGYKTDLVAGEDTELYRRLKKQGKIVFDRRLVVFESPRRFRKQGYLRTLWQWNSNNISVLFRKKAHSKRWEQVR